MIHLIQFALLGYSLALLLSRGRLPSPGAVFALGIAVAIPLCLIHPPLIWISGPLFISSVLYRKFPGRSAPLHSLRPPSLNRSFLIGAALAFLPPLYILVRLCGFPVLNYDVLSYHVPLAWEFSASTKGWLQSTSVLTDPGIFYGRMPLGAPILESLFLGSGNADGLGPQIAFLIAAAILAGGATAWRCARWLGAGHGGRAMAAALYIWHPLALKSLLQSVYDPIVALMAIAALEIVLQSLRGPHRMSLLAAAGFVAGSAVALKFSAIGTALVPLGIVLLLGAIGRRQAGRGCSCKAAIGMLAVFSVGAFFSLAPWLVRAQIIGGHPLHPFRGETAGWTAEQARFVVAVHSPQTPLSIRFWVDAVLRIRQFGYEVPLSGLSLLPLVALLTFLPGAGRRGLPLLAASLVGYLSWLTVRLNPDRFLLPSIVILIPCVAHLATRRWPLVWLRPILLALVLIVFIVEAWFSTLLATSFEPGYSHTRRRALADAYGTPGMMEVVRAARASDVPRSTWLFFEARGALFHGTAAYRTVWDQALYADELRQSQSAEDFASRLAEAGCTGIFVNEAEWGRFLDFYAHEAFGGDEKLFGTMNPDYPRALDGLESYPPHRFAGLTERDLTILLDFLRSQRTRATIVVPTGPWAEIWYAPLHP